MDGNKIIVWLLALLGFGAATAGCGNLMYGSPTPDEYGTPHASFEVKGKVTDQAGEPVRGIKISVNWDNPAIVSEDHLSATTDSKGEYVLQDSFAWPATGKLAVTATDVDGAENGGDFATKTVNVEVKESDYTGGSGSWNHGAMRKTADFELTEKP